MPNFVVEIVGLHLLDHDGIGVSQDFTAFRCYFTKDTYGQARPGERLAHDDFLGQSQFLAQFADFILEQAAQRFDQLELHLFRQATHVMVTLDERGRVAGDRHRLDNIRIKRSLCEKLGLAYLAGGLLEDIDKGVPNDFSLGLWIGDLA